MGGEDAATLAWQADPCEADPCEQASVTEVPPAGGQVCRPLVREAQDRELAAWKELEASS